MLWIFFRVMACVSLFGLFVRFLYVIGTLVFTNRRLFVSRRIRHVVNVISFLAMLNLLIILTIALVVEYHLGLIPGIIATGWILISFTKEEAIELGRIQKSRK